MGTVTETPGPRVLRFEVGSREALDRLAGGSLPAGLEGGAARLDFFRDIFFDTPAGDLERRGVTVRLCVQQDGTRTLSLDVREQGEGEATRSTHWAEVVTEEDVQAVFAGSTEPARRLRAMLDPGRLGVQLELETMRRVRDVTAATGAELRFHCDLVTLRQEDVVTEFCELEVSLPGQRPAGLDRQLEALERELELRVTLATRLARAREMLESLQLGALEDAVRAARVVAVIAYHEGAVALLRSGGVLRVPTGQGWGEEACRRVLRSALGRTQGQVRLLGTSAGVATRPAVEVWLAQGIRPAEGESAEAPLVWLPFEEVLQRVGSIELRDVATLATLHLAARHGLSGLPDALALGDPPLGDQQPFELRHVPTALTAATPPPAPVQESAKANLPPEALINTELSELAFNARVLALAEDPRTPLLERVRFLAILGSNLDQFFMTRVAGFHQQLASGSEKLTQDGLTPEEQLQVIGVRARQIYQRAYRFLWDRLAPDLRAEGVDILTWDQLSAEDREYLIEHYAWQLGAVLTPLAADPSHPFPHIRNLRPALGVIVRLPATRAEHFAAIELPGDLPRFVPLPGGRRFIPLEAVIAASLPTLYNAVEVVAAHTFRVTRSANINLDDEGISDLLQAVEEKVQQRPLGPAVRLEVDQSMPESMRTLLLRELQLESRDRVSILRAEDVYPVDRLVDLYGLREIAALPIDELHYPPMQRATPLDPRRSIWSTLRRRDVLVHFPYDSFEATVERLLADAARDDKVVSIKITLYRTSRSSRVVKLLRRARRAGKEVVALVELKASFDEQRNIEWARALESSGIHVVYGPPHLKVHAKIALVVRREDDGLRRYHYIGTGNLNAATAAAYTDLALLTTHPELGEELNDVFNGLTGYSSRTEYRHLLVAPFNMRRRFIELIDREAEHARAGRGGQVRVKLNGLTDRDLIAALYRASQAGARVELIVRGVCSLRPGVPGLSENIRVISILGRFLEHSRIYRFDNAGEPEYFIGSADWRPRNLSRRVEVITPIWDPEHRRVLDSILDEGLANPEAWELRADGSYLHGGGGGAGEGGR